jgi:hypothetical protein
VASVGSIVIGFAMPVFGILFGDILGVSKWNSGISGNYIEIFNHHLLAVVDIFIIHYIL